MVGILASLLYTTLYIPGYTLILLYLVLSMHHHPLTLRCPVRRAWAQKRRIPWVREEGEVKVLKGVKEERELCA